MFDGTLLVEYNLNFLNFELRNKLLILPSFTYLAGPCIDLNA